MSSPRKQDGAQVVVQPATPATPAKRHNRPRVTDLPFTVPLAALWLILVDAPRLIRLGPITLSGALLMVVTLLMLCLLPNYAINAAGRTKGPGATDTNSSRVPLPMWGFLLFVFGSFFVSTINDKLSLESIQNAGVYVAFVGAVAFSATATSPSLLLPGWDLMRNVATWYAYLALAVSVTGLIVDTGAADNLRFLYAPRSLAMMGIVALAIVLPGAPRNNWTRFAPLAMVAAMTFSLSRTSTVIGLASLVFFTLRRRRRTGGAFAGGRLLKGVLSLAAVAVAAYLLVAYYAPFRDRFSPGDKAWEIGDMAIGTMGRAKVWKFLLANSWDNPLFGHGVGSASQLIGSHFRLNHPHNEYLRLFFDFGAVGAGLFLAGYLLLAARIWRNARRTDHPLHWSAFIALLGIALVAITDNAFVYPHIMVPLGTLAGLSLALAGFEWSERIVGVANRPARVGRSWR